MKKLQLETAQALQGSFAIRDLNLLLVFQVNCPGCFVYALPLAAQLHQQYGQKLNVLGLSTAFEDFELNTADNTLKLLEQGSMVGVTKQYFQQQNIEQYPVEINFSVAFDLVGPESTFTVNRLRGTPSWILFDQDYNILTEWFGHRSETAVESLVVEAMGYPLPQP